MSAALETVPTPGQVPGALAYSCKSGVSPATPLSTAREVPGQRNTGLRRGGRKAAGENTDRISAQAPGVVVSVLGALCGLTLFA